VPHSLHARVRFLYRTDPKEGDELQETVGLLPAFIDRGPHLRGVARDRETAPKQSGSDPHHSDDMVILLLRVRALGTVASTSEQQQGQADVAM